MNINLIQTALCIRFYIKPNGNHKSKTRNRYAKNKEKGIQVYHQRKPTNHEKAKEEKTRENVQK